MAWLKGKTEWPTTPLKNSEIDETMHKYEETKGRDKGRTRFKYITNEHYVVSNTRRNPQSFKIIRQKITKGKSTLR